MRDSNQAHHQRMTATPVGRLTLSLGLPATVSILITMVYNMADTWFVSRLGSTEAVAAVGVAFSITTFTNALGYLFGMGSGTYIGRLLGGKRVDEAETVGSTAFYVSLVFCMAVTALSLCFLRPLMRFLGASDAVMPDAVAYGRFILLGIPIMCSSLVMSTILRCEGKTKLSMVGIGAGGILNILLDPVMIFVLHMGVAGAAVATLVSQSVSWLILLGFYLKGKSAIRLNIRRVSLRWAVLWAIFTTGFPSLCRHLITTLANISLNTAAGIFAGDATVAAMAIVSKIISLSLAVCTGIGQGAQTVFAYNHGAGLHARVRRTFYFTLLFNTCQMAVICALLCLFAPRVLSLFGASDAQAQVLAIGARALRIQSVTILLTPWNSLSNQIFQSVGQSGKSSLLASLSKGAYFIPGVFLLPLKMGADGILFAQPVADVLAALTALPFVLSYLRGTAAKLPKPVLRVD